MAIGDSLDKPQVNLGNTFKGREANEAMFLFENETKWN